MELREVYRKFTIVLKSVIKGFWFIKVYDFK